MKLFSPSEFSQKAISAFKRFPVTLLWVIIGTSFLVGLVNQDQGFIYDEYLNVTLTAILGVSWLIGSQFYIEQFKRKGLWWIKIIILVLLMAFYYSLPVYEPEGYNNEEIAYLRWILFFIAGHLALFFAPFITVWHPKAYWNYLSNMLMAIIRSALYSGVLYLGIVFAMLAIQFLFEVDIDDRRYFQLFLVCLGIVNTWVYLSDFPQDIQHAIHLNFHKAIEVFVKFILIPLAILYTIILYAYAIKIALQWELPKGWVSHLVTALALLLFLIQFMIHPVRISHPSRLIRKFQPLAYWILLPLLSLLFVAIYRRVSDYGITEARYFLILIAIFITGSSIYLIFSRKQQLRYLPIALAVLAIFSSFGFWGVFSVSKNSQLREFDEMYSAFAKMDKNLKIDAEIYRRFRSVTQYLTSRNAEEEINKIVGYNINEVFKNPEDYNTAEDILAKLNLEIENSFQRLNNATLSYNYADQGLHYIKGYDWSKTFYLDSYTMQRAIVEGYHISLAHTGKEILIKKDNKVLLELSCTQLIKELTHTPQTSISDRQRMQLIGRSENLDVKVNFNTLDLEKKSDSTAIIYAQGLVMLKFKE